VRVVEARRSNSGLRELALLLATLGLVMGATAGALRGLDSLAGYLLGEPKGVKRYRSVEEMERKIGARLVLPVYFPDTLEWPPAAVTLIRGASPVAALSFIGRAEDRPRLFIYQTFRQATAIPIELLQLGQLLHSTAVSLDGAEGELRRILGEDGEIWHVLGWRGAGRQFALRFKGPVEELLKIARSMGRSRQ
jgi:hypothetical protein